MLEGDPSPEDLFNWDESQWPDDDYDQGPDEPEWPAVDDNPTPTASFGWDEETMLFDDPVLEDLLGWDGVDNVNDSYDAYNQNDQTDQNDQEDQQDRKDENNQNEIPWLMADDNPTVIFNRDVPQWPMKFAWSPQTRDEAPRRWWHLRYYRGPEGQPARVLYSKTKSQSEAIAQYFANEPVLGFDMEWPWDADRRPRLRDKVALIQLASERKIALFHIALHEGEAADDLIAPTLKKIIESPKIIKAGVGVMSADFKRLRAHFNLEPKGAFELSHLHNLLMYAAGTGRRVTTRLYSLSAQVEQYLGLPLWKGNVRTSNWSRPLNNSQFEYAASDAYAGFMLFHCMNAKRLAMNPVPPLPIFAEAYPPSTSKPTIIQLESVTKDGEVRITTAHEFFGVKKSVKRKREASDKVDSSETNDKGEASNSNEHGKSERKRSQTAWDRKPRTNAKKAGDGSAQTSLDDSCWALYHQLASHRKRLALSKNIPAFVIAHNTLLEALALHRPSNEQELLLVPGVGRGKLAEYGPAWLEIIASFETQQKQGGDRDIEQASGGQAEHEGFDPELDDQDLKRRRIDHGGRSKEIVMQSDAAPTVLSSGVSFQFGETGLTDKVLVVPRSVKKGDPEEEEDDAVFGSPMELPSSLALKPKREIIAQSNHGDEQSPSQSAMRVPVSLTKPLSTVDIAPPIGPVPASNVDSKPPAFILAPTPVPPFTTAATATGPQSQTPLERSDWGKTILRNKLEAYIKTVVWAMDPRPTESLVTADTLRHLVNAVPQTVEEFRRVPGIQRLTGACEAVKMDIWRTFEKWTQSTGSSSSTSGAGLTR
ncbi:hypothetical protein ANO14919_006300 [Xylariales sp. No.14919]|nr:hypothetical protein ANO14919_006300 [Xylariales sp. No.14919]